MSKAITDVCSDYTVEELARTRYQLHTGRPMPVMGLGTWQLTHDTAGAVAHALASGYQMVDTSGDYGTQPGAGAANRESEVPRDEVYLVTNVEEHEHALQATGKNMEELRLDQADLMLIHRPPTTGAGVELWKGLVAARNDGLTIDIDVSNYSTTQIQELAETTGDCPWSIRSNGPRSCGARR